MAFLGFGKRRKPNLVADVQFPQQGQLYFTNKDASREGRNLRDIAGRRLKGDDLGFGPGFVSRQSNPAIAQIDANFQNRTLPTLSSEASKRGLARSSIVTDQIGQADLQRNRDIQSAVSQFELLNKQQEKSDFGQALDLSKYLQDQEAGMLRDEASASERLVGRTTDRANQFNQQDAATRQQALSAAAGIVGSPAFAGFGSSIGGMLSKALGQGASPKVSILGGLSDDDFLTKLSGGSKFSINQRMPISRYY